MATTTPTTMMTRTTTNIMMTAMMTVALLKLAIISANHFSGSIERDIKYNSRTPSKSVKYSKNRASSSGSVGRGGPPKFPPRKRRLPFKKTKTPCLGKPGGRKRLRRRQQNRAKEAGQKKKILRMQAEQARIQGTLQDHQADATTGGRSAYEDTGSSGMFRSYALKKIDDMHLMRGLRKSKRSVLMEAAEGGDNQPSSTGLGDPKQVEIRASLKQCKTAQDVCYAIDPDEISIFSQLNLLLTLERLLSQNLGFTPPSLLQNANATRRGNITRRGGTAPAAEGGEDGGHSLRTKTKKNNGALSEEEDCDDDIRKGMETFEEGLWDMTVFIARQCTERLLTSLESSSAGDHEDNTAAEDLLQLQKLRSWIRSGVRRRILGSEFSARVRQLIRKAEEERSNTLKELKNNVELDEQTNEIGKGGKEDSKAASSKKGRGDNSLLEKPDDLLTLLPEMLQYKLKPRGPQERKISPITGKRQRKRKEDEPRKKSLIEYLLEDTEEGKGTPLYVLPSQEKSRMESEKQPLGIRRRARVLKTRNLLNVAKLPEYKAHIFASVAHSKNTPAGNKDTA
eukprot:jgi/Bigna1/67277/fgenesh1_pg.3_\